MSRRKSITKKGPQLLPAGKPTAWESVADTASSGNNIIIAKLSPTNPSQSQRQRKQHNHTNPPPSMKNNAFDRLYQKGKEQSDRKKLRTDQKYNRPPMNCTFQPITNTIQAAIEPVPTNQFLNEVLNSIVGSVETVGKSGGDLLQSRDLLHTEYQSRMLEYHRQRQTAAINATRRDTDTFNDLYKDGKVKLDQKIQKEKEHKSKVPVDCTFQPMLSPKKGITGKKTKYYERAALNAAKRSNGDISHFKRTDLLYAEKLDERNKRKELLQIKLKEDAKYIVKNPYANPETENKNTNGGKDKNGKKIKTKRSPRGLDADGKFIKYNKITHRQQIERIEFLKQSKECTFSPRVNKGTKPSMGGNTGPSVFDRLLKGRDHSKRKKKRIEKLSNDCTFSPQINGNPGSPNKNKMENPGQKKRGDVASNRLYTSGQKALKKRQQKFQNRERPTFRPDLSATSTYRAKRPDGEKKRKRKGGRGGKNVKNPNSEKNEDGNENKKSSSYAMEDEDEDASFRGKESEEFVKQIQKIDNTIQEIADDADKDGVVLCHAVVMYDYDGSGSDGRNISLKAGQIVKVTEMDLESYPETDGWWHGSVNDGPWGAFPLSYVHCVIKRKEKDPETGGDVIKDYLLLTSDWAVHTAKGDKKKVGIYNPVEKKLMKPNGDIIDWNACHLVGEKSGTVSTKRNENDVSINTESTETTDTTESTATAETATDEANTSQETKTTESKESIEATTSEETNADVRGLVGVDDATEDKLLEEAQELVGERAPSRSDDHRSLLADDADKNGKVLCHAVAMYNFDGSGSNDRNITLKVGDVVNCTEMENDDGWWHGSVADGPWGAFPFSYVHCVLQKKETDSKTTKDYLLLPSDWAVHKSDGDKAKIGTYDPATKMLTTGEGEVVSWEDAKLV